MLSIYWKKVFLFLELANFKKKKINLIESKKKCHGKHSFTFDVKKHKNDLEKDSAEKNH
jgi:hypothetical protein